MSIMQFIKRTSENHHDWLILLNVDVYDAAMISMISNAPLMNSNNTHVMYFKS